MNLAILLEMFLLGLAAGVPVAITLGVAPFLLCNLIGLMLVSHVPAFST